MVMTACFPTFNAAGQTDRSLYARTQPLLPFQNPEPTRYNLKWGRLTGRFFANAQVEYNDNINLADTGAIGDISFGPNLGIGFLYPLTKEHVLQLDLSGGYRWYLNHPSVSSFSVLPNSRLDYTMTVKDVRINIHDRFGVQVDPTSRVDINGKSSTPILFRRFNNVLGVSADWQPAKRLVLFGGYDWEVDRSLSSQFDTLDHDGHTFYAGFDYVFTPRLTGGMNASYTITQYALNVQNDGSGYTFGPHLTWKPSPFLTLSASAGWSVSEFGSSGTIGDTSDFGGIYWQVAARHTINPRASEDVRFSHGTSLGFGSNYSENYALQYGLQFRVSGAVTIQTSLGWEHFRSSGPAGEQADRFIASIGTGFKLTRNWHLGGSYSFASKDSDAPGRDYVQNRVTLEFTRAF